MSNKLFVGGLAWATTDESLRAAFEPYGEVADARVIVDRETGRSRGFGFVTYRDAESAKKAIESMHGADVDGRSIRVNEAQERRGGPGGPRPGGPPDRRPGGPPRGEGRPGPGRDYPPVERRGGEGRSSGPPGGGGYGGG
ncbi:MAG: RNA-binding protein, partial [Myxococcales bacterium]|nr:RNA-binding protein [Myxococcales bacterium]